MTTSIKIFFFALLFLSIPMMGMAQTLSWDKNSEPDMKDYGVYMCFTPGCVVSKTPAMLQGFVTHPTTSFPMPLAKEGTAGVTARDTASNESPLSVPLPFDLLAPKTPVNPRQLP